MTVTMTMTSKSPPRQEQQQQQQVSAASDMAPPPLKPVFVPKFKGAAEMDERRRLRLQARRGAAAAAAASPPEIRVVAVPEKGSTFELISSGEDEEEMEEEDSYMQVEDEDFDDVVDVGVSVDIEDGFDPCVFPPPLLRLRVPAHAVGGVCHQRVRYNHDIRQRLGRTIRHQRKPIYVQFLQLPLPTAPASPQPRAPQPRHRGQDRRHVIRLVVPGHAAQ